ncbi:MAG: LysE family translocator [Actinomycetota bacterium]
MVIPSNLWEFIVTSIVIIIAPGPSVLFIIARAVAWGRSTAVFSALGNVIGAFLLSVLVAIGLGPLLQRSEIAYTLVQWGGGAYLLYLGIETLKHRHLHAEEMVDGKSGHPSTKKSIRDGFFVGVLNPKTLVFFAAVLPQFIDREEGHVTAQLLFLGTAFALMAFASDGSWGLIAGTARTWLAGDKRRLIFLRSMGGYVMLLLGSLVIFAATKHALS